MGKVNESFAQGLTRFEWGSSTRGLAVSSEKGYFLNETTVYIDRFGLYFLHLTNIFVGYLHTALDKWDTSANERGSTLSQER